MKKILYVDTDAPVGHINFNRIWLSVLSKSPVELTTCMPKAFHNGIGLQIKNIPVPKCLCRGKGPIFWRLFSVLRLLWLRIFVNTKKYDAVIIASFENTTLSCILPFFPCENLFCICHNNIELARNNRKHRSFLNFIAKRVNMIALNHSMKKYLDSMLDIRKTIFIQHGFQPSMPPASSQSGSFIDDFSHGKEIIFVPSLTSASEDDLLKIQRNELLCANLKKYDLKLFISKKMQITDASCFHSFSRRLNDDEYAAIFQRARVILLLYPESFFRLSAILHEAIANNKTLLLPDREIFSEYKAFIPEFLFYKSIEHIGEILSSPQIRQPMQYRIPDYMRTPVFNELFEIIPTKEKKCKK